MPHGKDTTPAKERVRSILATLIGYDTTSSKPNAACIAYIRDFLAQHGVTSHIVQGWEEGKACLFATLPDHQGQISGGILLSGHSDVVPVDGQEWTHDPFTLWEQNGRLYGRGTCDMKGFMAAILALIPTLTTTPLKQPVHIAFTHDEESTMAGAESLTSFLKTRGLVPDWVWIGEPTEFHVINAHKGVAAYTTAFTGVPAHSGKPALGLNAIGMAHSFMGIVDRVAAERAAKPFTPSRFDPPYTTVNFGTIAGGTAENIVAEHCTLLWQVRAHPGDSAAAVLAAVENDLPRVLGERLAAFAPVARVKTCPCFDIPPLMPTPDNAGERILGELTGHRVPEAVSFATEAGFFQSLGCGVVVCGPGSIDVAHKADEYVTESALFECVDLMARVLL